MTLSTLRHDSAIRSLPRWGAVSLGAMGVLLGFRAFFEFASAPGSETTGFWDMLSLVATLWIPVSIYVFYMGITGRCSRLDMTLPVSPRWLWIRHLAGVLVSSVVVLTLCAALLSVQNRGLRGWLDDDTFLLGPSVSSLYPLFLSALVLSCVLLQTHRPSLRKIEFDRSYTLFAMLTLSSVFALVVVLSAIPVTGAVIPLALAVWVGRRTYLALPRAYGQVSGSLEEISVDEAQSMDGETLTATDGHGVRNALIVRTVWTTVWGWKALFYIPFVMVFGALLAGLPYSLTDETDTRFANIAISWYMLLSMLPAVMKRLYTVDALPIPRALLFACLAGPGILATAAGYGAAELIAMSRAEPREHIRMWENNDHYYLTVPPENCELAWDGAPRKNTSPSGETHDAWRTGLYKDSPLGIYSPFSTPPGSSIEFVAWQISRAVNAVYSADLSPEEIKSRYLEIDAEGRVIPRHSKLTIKADHSDLVTRGRGRVFPVAMLAACLPFFLLTWVYLAAFGVGVSSARRIWIPVALLVGIMALHVAGFAGAVLKYYTLWVHTAFVKIIIRHLDAALPGGTPVLWTLCGIVLCLGYRFAQRRFERIEIPATRQKQTD